MVNLMIEKLWVWAPLLEKECEKNRLRPNLPKIKLRIISTSKLYLPK